MYMEENYIGENIKIYRERKRMTQRELADRIGKTWEMVSRYERGYSSPMKQLNALAKVLEVDVADLLSSSPQRVKREEINRVPFFTFLPEDMDFMNTPVYTYYIAPDWILERDEKCFVIDSSLLEINIDGLNRKGYLFISPNSKVVKGDTVLTRDGSLNSFDYENHKDEEILGKALAFEVIL